MRIGRTARFKKAYMHLTSGDRQLARKAIEQLKSDMRYPALRVRKMAGAGGFWEARVSRSIRMTFQLQDDLILLRNIGKHDETLGRP